MKIQFISKFDMPCGTWRIAWYDKGTSIHSAGLKLHICAKFGESNGLNVIVKEGWVVKKYQDGTIEQLEKVANSESDNELQLD